MQCIFYFIFLNLTPSINDQIKYINIDIVFLPFYRYIYKICVIYFIR
jgi:hypothetical protein